MENNVYIKAMEIGFKNPNGIKYSILKEKVEATSKKMGRFLEPAFMKWVGEYFDSDYPSHQHIVNHINKAKPYLQRGTAVDQMYKKAYEDFTAKIWVIKGTTVKQYIDYLELKESRVAASNAQVASIEANKKSSTSIRLAIGAIIASVVLGLISIYTSPKPPFDVKVIEDTTKAKLFESKSNELLKENKELKEQLYQAEILIETYESDSLKVG